MKTLLTLIALASLTSCTVTENADGSKSYVPDPTTIKAVTKIISQK